MKKKGMICICDVLHNFLECYHSMIMADRTVATIALGTHTIKMAVILMALIDIGTTLPPLEAERRTGMTMVVMDKSMGISLRGKGTESV